MIPFDAWAGNKEKYILFFFPKSHNSEACELPKTLHRQRCAQNTVKHFVCIQHSSPHSEALGGKKCDQHCYIVNLKKRNSLFPLPGA